MEKRGKKKAEAGKHQQPPEKQKARQCKKAAVPKKPVQARKRARAKVRGKKALSWVCRYRYKSSQFKPAELILCYDHSRHFTIRDDYERVKRAIHNGCQICAEGISVSDYASVVRDFLKRECGLEDLNSVTREMMAVYAENKARGYETEAQDWRKLAAECREGKIND